MSSRWVSGRASVVVVVLVLLLLSLLPTNWLHGESFFFISPSWTPTLDINLRGKVCYINCISISHLLLCLRLNQLLWFLSVWGYKILCPFQEADWIFWYVLYLQRASHSDVVRVLMALTPSRLSRCRRACEYSSSVSVTCSSLLGYVCRGERERNNSFPAVITRHTGDN